MRYREVELLATKTVADSGTETVDVDVLEPITAIIVNLDLTNGGSAVADAPPESIISKIEIVDGGRVLVSLSGQQAVAAAVLERGGWPDHWYDERANSGQSISIPLFFGRWDGDETFAFNPQAYSNPQVKVTWAKASGHATGGVQLGVMARVMEDVAAPSQALFWKTVRTFTSAASGEEPTDMPMENPWRRLLIRAYLTDQSPWQILTRFKLDCDAGKFIPLDLTTTRLINVMRTLFGFTSHKSTIRRADNAAVQPWLGSDTQAQVTPEAIDAVARIWLAGGSVGVLRAINTAGGYLGVGTYEVLFSGTLPHSSFCYQFGDFDIAESWFPSAAYKGAKLKLTQGAANAAVAIILQEAIRQ